MLFAFDLKITTFKPNKNHVYYGVKKGYLTVLPPCYSRYFSSDN